MTKQHQVIAAEIAGRRHAPEARERADDKMKRVRADLTGMSRDQMEELIHELLVQLAERDIHHEQREQEQEKLARRAEQKMARTREELSSRQQALEAVYAMTTAFSGSLDAQFDQVALTVCSILRLPFAVVLHIKDGKALAVAQVDGGILEHPLHILHDCPLLAELAGRRVAYQLAGDLHEHCGGCSCLQSKLYRSHIGVPILGPHGELVGAICSFGDSEESFGDYERHLIEIFGRYLSHEVSRVRMEEQLRQSNEMKLLGQLTSGVAHEVRNPLNAIAAITEAIFVELAGKPELEPYKEHIDRQVGRLSALMEDLLMLGRPIREESMRSISLWALVTEVVRASEYGPEAPRSGIKLSLPDESRQWHVLGDNLKLHQVFVNLLENARQHSPSDVAVELILDRPTQDTARLRIIDGGCGVHPDNLTRIFEPFFTTRKSGTGLGLSIVRRIVESHGGSIELFNNDPPPGLTAEIRLPLALPQH